jgi:hypothetical protein
MGGYLANYGAGEEQREKLRNRLILFAAVLLIVAGVLYLLFKNYRQERQARYFFELLREHDYQGAYRLWGCTENNPCRDYPLDRFMEDWGPNSPRAGAGAFRVTKSRSCGSGVILTVDLGKHEEEKLWVERSDLTIGFSPYPGCPPAR